MERVYYTFMPSPVGRFLVVGTAAKLFRTAFSESEQFKLASEWIEDSAPLAYAISPLQSYFNGEMVEFDVPLALVGTEFQLSVWNALQKIEYGKTASYGDIAHMLGKPGASRAVGGANHANPIPIIVPCHRIIGADGSMTGFGGGMENKKILLKLEGIYTPPEQLSFLPPDS